MGTSNLTERSNTIFDATWWNQIRAALMGLFVPRNGSGVPEDLAGSLGTPELRWNELHVQRATIGGVLLEPQQLVGRSHRIASGKAKTSGYPDFLAAAGSGNGLSASLLATDVPLEMSIDGETVVVEADTPFGSLTAAPGSNNTAALATDGFVQDQESTKLIGEHGGHYFTISSVGSAITALNGTVAAMLLGSEVMLGRIDTSAGRFYPIHRGWAGTNAETANFVTDSLTLLKLSTLLINVDGLTKVASTYYPESVGVAPAAGTAGKIYLERDTGRVAYDDGATVSYDYMIVGWAVCDAADCEWVQPYDFDLLWSDLFKVSFERPATTTQRVKRGSVVSVNGKPMEFRVDADMTIAGNMDSGQVIANGAQFYIYLKHDGSLAFSAIAPRGYCDFKKGHYHPHQYYRCIGHTTTISGASTFYVAAIPMEWEGTHDVEIRGSDSATTVMLPPAALLKGKSLRYRRLPTEATEGTAGTAVITLSSIFSADQIGASTASGGFGQTYAGLISIRDFIELTSKGTCVYDPIDFLASMTHDTTLTTFNSTAPPIEIHLTRRGGGKFIKGVVTIEAEPVTPAGTKNGTSNPALTTALPAIFRPSQNIIVLGGAAGAAAELLAIGVSTAGQFDYDIFSGDPWVNGGSYAIIGFNVTTH